MLETIPLALLHDDAVLGEQERLLPQLVAFQKSQIVLAYQSIRSETN